MATAKSIKMHLIQGLKCCREVKMMTSQHINRHGLLAVGELVKNSECGFLMLNFLPCSFSKNNYHHSCFPDVVAFFIEELIVRKILQTLN